MFSRHWLALSLFVLAPGLRAADSRPPASAEDKARLVKVAAELEAAPLGKAADESRAWARSLVSNSPDVDGLACELFFAPVIGSESKFADILVQQLLISSAAYYVQLKDAPEPGDDSAPWLEAGVRGMLQSYLSIKKVTPKERIAYLDGLAELDKQGRLTRYVADGWVVCRQMFMKKGP